jgi:Ribbon-helix-helix protein, copG family
MIAAAPGLMMQTCIVSHRTQITLTDSQYARLLKEAERTGLGLAALIRQALATVYGDVAVDDALEALAASAGSWKGKEEDGEAYVDALRPGIAQCLRR